jgi:TrmH family RNA methyltransferase
MAEEKAMQEVYRPGLTVCINHEKPMTMSFRLVLVSPREPGNVGACARIAANFEINDWVIATPQCRWDDWDAKKYATADSARKLLEKARTASSVAEAVAGCEAAVGFTRRQGRIRAPSLEMSELAELPSPKGRVALVFGNEETGLTFDELEACTQICTIPTSEDLGSMNLSHAVAVVLSRIYEERAAAKRPKRGIRKHQPAPLELMQAFLEHWREFLVDSGLDRGGNPERMIAATRPIFDRAGLTRQEIQALRGVLSKAQVQIGSRVRGKRVSRGSGPVNQ